MKQIALAIFLIASSLVHAQVLNIEDQDFLNALIAEGVDENFDGMIQVSEAEAVYDLNISNRDFRSIAGIEGFVNLERLLISSNDLIDTINTLVLPGLKKIRILDNKKLNTITLSGHPSLEEISITGTGISGEGILEGLEIANMSSLVNVRVHSTTSLFSLEIYDNENITGLSLVGNHALPYVDLTDLISLKTLDLRGPGQSLSQAELGTYPLLEVYNIGIQNPQPLDLSKFPNLKELNFYDSYGSTTLIEIFDHPTLEKLYIENYFNLVKVHCKNLKSLKTLLISDFSDNLKKIELDSLLSIEEISVTGIDELNAVSITNAPQLKELKIGGYLLRTLDLYNLPVLQDLEISGHRLKDLDVTMLNALTALKVNSSSIEYLYCKNNTNENLNCEDCESLRYICVDETDTYLVNPSVAISAFCPHTSEGMSHEIRGNILYDFENNGCDSLAIPMRFLSLAVHDSDSMTGLIISNATGEYRLYYDDTLYLKPADNAFNAIFHFDPDSILLTVNDSIRQVTQNICVSPVVLVPNLDLILLDPQESRPGEVVNYKLKIKNIGSTIPQGTLRLDFEGDYMTLDEAIPAPIYIDSNRLEWNLPEIRPLEEEIFEVSFELNRPTDTFPLNDGDTLQYKVSAVVDTPPDKTSFLNIFYDIVVNSFDPNDKQCMQGSRIEQQNLEDFLYYMIRFENLGTADARNIVVQDTLDAESYVLSSFQLVEASHEVYASMDENVISFIFEDINLAFNDDDNDGYVIFKIQPKEELEVDHNISNRASIYFDYNFPVHTNITQTQVIADIISKNTNVARLINLDLYPSISNRFIYLSDKFFHGEVALIDMQGAVMNKIMVSPGEAIDISSLKTGVHLLKLVRSNEVYIGKFIKI